MIIPAEIVRALVAAAEEARNVLLDTQEPSPEETALSLRLGKAILRAREFLKAKPKP